MADAFTVLCDHCDKQPATLFCQADAVFLCQSCDAEVHSNRISLRHQRVPCLDCPAWAYRDAKLRGRLREWQPAGDTGPIVSNAQNDCGFYRGPIYDPALLSLPSYSSNAAVASAKAGPSQDAHKDGLVQSEGSILASSMHANLVLNGAPFAMHQQPFSASPAADQSLTGSLQHASFAPGIMTACAVENSSTPASFLGNLSSCHRQSLVEHRYVPSPDGSSHGGLYRAVPGTEYAMLGSSSQMAGLYCEQATPACMSRQGSGLFGSLKSSSTQLAEVDAPTFHRQATHTLDTHRPGAFPSTSHAIPIPGAMPSTLGPAHGIPHRASQPIPIHGSPMAPQYGTNSAAPPLPLTTPHVADWTMSDPGYLLGLSAALGDDSVHGGAPGASVIIGSLPRHMAGLSTTAGDPASSSAASLAALENPQPRLSLPGFLSGMGLPQPNPASSQPSSTLKQEVPSCENTMRGAMQAAALLRSQQHPQAGGQQVWTTQQQPLHMHAGGQPMQPQQPVTPHPAGAGGPPGGPKSTLPPELLAATTTAAPRRLEYRPGTSAHILPTPASVIEARAQALISSASRTAQPDKSRQPENLVTRLEFPDGTVRHLDMERAQQLHRYRQKRLARLRSYADAQKKVRHESRKHLADTRPRIKGRFTKIHSSDNLDALLARLGEAAGITPKPFGDSGNKHGISRSVSANTMALMGMAPGMALASSLPSTQGVPAPAVKGELLAQQQQAVMLLLAQHTKLQSQQAVRRALSCTDLPNQGELLAAAAASMRPVLDPGSLPSSFLPNSINHAASPMNVQSGTGHTSSHGSGSCGMPAASSPSMVMGPQASSHGLLGLELSSLGGGPSVGGHAFAQSPADRSEQTGESVTHPQHVQHPNPASCSQGAHMQPDGGPAGTCSLSSLGPAPMMDMDGLGDVEDIGGLDCEPRPCSPFGDFVFSDQQMSSVLDALLNDDWGA